MGRARGGRLVGWHLPCTEEQPGFESPPLHQDRRLLGSVDGEHARSRVDELKTNRKGIGQVVMGLVDGPSLFLCPLTSAPCPGEPARG